MMEPSTLKRRSRETRSIHRWRWAALILGLAILAAGLRALWWEPASLIVTEERISLPLAARGSVRVAILTDLHVGSPFNGPAKLRDVVERTNAARPDIICILGDLVIQGVIAGQFVPPEQIAGELKALRAPAGVFAVLGNHDGWFDHDRVKRALEQNAIRVIEESAVKTQTPVDPLWIAGISDLWTGVHDMRAALAAVKDGAPVILLTHNPDVFPDVPARVALTLAGHTHGGQVRLPFVGRPIVPSQFGQRYAAGHVIENGRHLFVATGVGTSILPVRFRVPPAVTVLAVESE